MSNKSQLIYDAAREFLGTKEWPGPKSNPEIMEMFALAPDWLNQDDSKTPWCGIFRGYVGYLTATGMPLAHYRAANWLKWGSPVHGSPIRGDTVIKSRVGGNHVGVVDRLTEKYVFILGGNQSDSVTITRYLRSAITGYRRI